MNHPEEKLTNEAFINGIREADEAVLEVIFTEYRKPAVRAIAGMGGSEAAGRSFFRTALVEIAKQDHLGLLSLEVPYSQQLNAICLAHFKDWLTEKEQPVPEVEQQSEEQDQTIKIPAAEDLRATRATIEAWKKGVQTEDALYPFWEKLRIVDQKHSDVEKTKPKNTFNRNLLIVTVLLAVAYLVYIFVFQTKTPAEVYDDNFSMPKSLVDDLSSRYGPERGNDSVTARPNTCELYLREADQYYTAGDHETAQSILLNILNDSLTVCHSDALFYIGIIALEQERPELALECFSKIEDLEHYGEDIYWYQALAFVKLAEKNPFFRDKATRAVERERSNARDSIRRIQAEKMLKHLEQ